MILIVLLQNSTQNSPGVPILHILLKMGLKSKDSLVIISLVDQIQSKILGELFVEEGVLSAEDIIGFGLSMDKLLFHIS